MKRSILFFISALAFFNSDAQQINSVFGYSVGSCIRLLTPRYSAEMIVTGRGKIGKGSLVPVSLGK